MADTTETKDKSDFTAREMEIMTVAWTCMTEEPKVDYKKLAEACGMTNPRSASNAWAAIKKKIIAKAGIVKGDGDGEGGASPTKKTPKATPRKRTKKAEAETNGDDAEVEESPMKKTKATPKKGRGKVKSEPVVEEGDDGEGEGAVKEVQE